MDGELPQVTPQHEVGKRKPDVLGNGNSKSVTVVTAAGEVEQTDCFPRGSHGDAEGVPVPGLGVTTRQSGRRTGQRMDLPLLSAQQSSALNAAAVGDLFPHSAMAL